MKNCPCVQSVAVTSFLNNLFRVTHLVIKYFLPSWSESSSVTQYSNDVTNFIQAQHPNFLMKGLITQPKQIQFTISTPTGHSIRCSRSWRTRWRGVCCTREAIQWTFFGANLAKFWNNFSSTALDKKCLLNCTPGRRTRPSSWRRP